MSLTSESGEWSTYITPSSIETVSPPFNSYTSPFSSFTLQPSLQGASAFFSASIVSSLESLPAMTVTVCGFGSIFEMVRACAGAAQSKVVTPSVATPIDLMPPSKVFRARPYRRRTPGFCCRRGNSVVAAFHEFRNCQAFVQGPQGLMPQRLADLPRGNRNQISYVGVSLPGDGNRALLRKRRAWRAPQRVPKIARLQPRTASIGEGGFPWSLPVP